MTTYYVDAANGSDKNSGTSAGTAFQSVAKISSMKLKAGDTVLLARGSSFADMLTINGSGTTDQPITIAAYGQGADPTFVGKQGIYGTKTSNIVIKDLTFSTSFNAIYAAQTENWVIDHVSLINAGAGTGTGSISMKTSKNVTISNSKFDNVSNDGIYVVDMTDLKIVNNVMTNLKGGTADGIQVTNSSNVRMTGNVIDQSTSPDSTKGGIIVNNSSNVVASGNEVKGGSFGIAINGWDVEITDNKLSGQNKYGWSSAIMASAGINLGNYKISGNEIVGSNFGVALTGLSRDGDVTRQNMDISKNTFVSVATAALKIDKQTTGTFHDNVVIDSTLSQIKGNGLTGAFNVVGNVQTTAANAPSGLQAEAAAAVQAQVDAAAKAQAVAIAKAQADAAAAKLLQESYSENLNKALKVGINADRYAMDVSGTKMSGNIMDNDINAAGNKLSLSSFNGTRIGTSGLDLKGTYGTLHIDQKGHFTYELDSNALAKLKNVSAPVESFQYKANDSGKVVTSNLTIDLAAYIRTQDSGSAAAKAALKAGQPIEKAKAVDDFYKIAANAQTVVGNVSTNDLTSDGSTLSLRTVGGQQLSKGAVDLKGAYGTLHIDGTGAFTYTLDADANMRMVADHKTSDSFVYKAAIGGSYDQGALVIDLTPHLSAGDMLVL